MRCLLDTCVCIPLINRTDDALKNRLLARPPNSIALCSIVRAELYYGARHSTRVAENLDRVERFCRTFESLPFDDDAANHYGMIRAQLSREGRPIGANDLLIAAIALSHGLRLATRNIEEFRRVPGLQIEAW